MSVISSKSFHYTDLGNAKRLIARNGTDLRYCPLWHKWLVWNGCRWAIDETQVVMQSAKTAVLNMYAEAATLSSDAERKELVAHAKRSESEGALRHMIYLAGSEPGVPILPEELDCDPWLLNCQNGTLDLRSGTLKPHDRQDLITKLVPVDYNPQAPCPLWMGFLKRVTNGNDQLCGYLQRMAGYALTGLTREQLFFILFGGGGNGKSTFLETLADMLGDYALTTPTETLLVRRSDGVPNDVARLKGARLVIATEAEEGRRLDSERIKKMTGSDTISARFMRAEWFDFRPEFKLVLACNHKPEVTDTTDSIWRRIRLIPFGVKIPEEERDKDFLNKLRREWPGILAWAVQGYTDWQREGFGACQVVTAATAAYRTEMDLISGFLDECCNQGSEEKVLVSELYSTYEQWCRDGRETAATKKKFGKALREKGFQTRRSGANGNAEWHGLSAVSAFN